MTASRTIAIAVRTRPRRFSRLWRRCRREAERVGGAVVVVMSLLLVDVAPRGAQVDDREHEGDQDQDVAQGGTLPELELHERGLVRLQRDGLGRIGRASAGEAQD